MIILPRRHEGMKGLAMALLRGFVACKNNFDQVFILTLLRSSTSCWSPSLTSTPKGWHDSCVSERLLRLFNPEGMAELSYVVPRTPLHLSLYLGRSTKPPPEKGEEAGGNTVTFHEDNKSLTKYLPSILIVIDLQK